MYLTIPEIIFSPVVLIPLWAGIQYLIAIWIKSRLEHIIKHEYDKKLEEFRFDIYQREQAVGIAKLFAKWAKYSGKEDELLDEYQKADHFEELNRLNWELAIWVPNEEIVKKINKRLINAFIDFCIAK